MTCIVYKHPYIVADQRTTEGSMIFGTMNKIQVEITDDYKLYAAQAGTAGVEKYVLEYIKYSLELIEHDQDRFSYLERRIGVDNKENDRVEVIAILVTKDATRVLSYDSNMLCCEAKAPHYVGGSGSRIALGALAMGADPFKAVAIACEWNSLCGYPINGYNVLTGEASQYNTPLELEMRAKESVGIKFGITVPELTEALQQASKRLGRAARFADLPGHQYKIF